MVIDQTEIIRKFIFSCKSNVCFLRVPERVISDEIKQDFFVIDVSKDYSPYKPFLTILANDENRPEMETIEKSVYSIQRESLVSFFENGIANERYDLPLNNELIYEQNRFIKPLVKAFEKLGNKNFMILNAQCLSECSLSMIKALENSKFKGKFAFCFSSFENSMEATDASKFLDEYRTKSNFLHLIADELTITHDKTEYNRILDLSENDQYVVIYKTLRNNRIFMCPNQLKEFATWFTDNFSNFNFDEEQKRVLSLELAKCLYECDMIDEAILYLNDIVDMQIEDEITAKAYFHLSRSFVKKKNQSLATKYLVLATKAFERNNNKEMLALCSVLDFQLAKNNSAENTIEKYQKTLKLLEEQQFWNNYISVAISIPWKLINDASARKSIDDEIDKSLLLAKKIDNQHLVSTCCHWKGIICSHYGEMDKALEWYDKCNEIRTKIGEIGPLLNIRNGLCYDATCRAMYKRAYDLENTIIDRLYDLSDFVTITDALKNLSYALFYSRHFSEAYEIFNVISNYLQVFEMDDCANNSFLPSMNDILLFKSIIDFDLGDVVRGRINHANIMRNIDSLTLEDSPFLYLIEAVLNADEGDVFAAERLFGKGIVEFTKIKTNLAHKIVFANYEFAVNLNRLGYKKEASKYMKAGFEIAKENGFLYFTQNRVKPLTVKQYLNGIEKFDPLNLNISFLNEKAEKEQLLSVLHKRIHDYQFLNKVKTSYIRDLNVKKYIQTVLMNINEYTLADEIHFGMFGQEGYKTFDSITKDEDSIIDSEVWETLFLLSKKSENAQLVYDSRFGFYYGDLSFGEYNFGLIIKPSKENPFNSDIVNTISIALTSIQSQVVIYKQEEHLMIMSSTDQLSRLKNRHAFQECIALESERVRRYQQRRETVIQIAVGFIDLDNFKYYNDTFGHSVGDLLIKNFANLLRETCRKIDFISRYGGDEFVIIMVDTNAAEGRRVFQRLQEGLKEHNYFIPQIRSLLKEDELTIPDDKKIGFSMGISTNSDTPSCDNLDLVVQNADKALYYSKQHHKGTVSVWSEIKDKISDE